MGGAIRYVTQVTLSGEGKIGVTMNKGALGVAGAWRDRKPVAAAVEDPI